LTYVGRGREGREGWEGRERREGADAPVRYSAILRYTLLSTMIVMEYITTGT
jgi:hypothetical protein